MSVSTEEFMAAVDDPMPAGDLMEFRFNVWCRSGRDVTIAP
jgi:hypothetical protein